MQATIQRKDIVKALGIVNKIIPNKTPQEILKNVLIETFKDDAMMVISSNNLDMSVQYTIPAIIPLLAESDTVTIPARLLNEFVTALTEDDISITPVSTSPQGILITAGKSKASILGNDPKEFYSPNSFSYDDTSFTMSIKTFCSMVRQTVFAISTEIAQPIFTGVLLQINDGLVTMVAADTFRMAIRHDIIHEKISIPDTMIPGKNLALIASMLDSNDEGNITIYLSKNNQIIFVTPTLEVHSSLLEARFPDYEKIVPKDTANNAIVKVDDLKNAGKVAGIFARSETGANSVKLTLVPSRDEIVLESQNKDIGDAEATVGAKITGEEVSILFNIKYLTDVLSIIDTQEVMIGLNSPKLPGVITMPNNGDYNYIIMPMFQRG